MKIGLIYARSRNGVIGHQGKMPWHLPGDLEHFKKVTSGGVVIMGRKTWESLPIKPLPGRVNVVLTRDKNYKFDRSQWDAGKNCFLHFPVKPVASLEEALEISSAYPSSRPWRTNTWVIGGKELFSEALPMACEAWVTNIDRDFEGDVRVPALCSLDWVMTQTKKLNENGVGYEIARYEKTGQADKNYWAYKNNLDFAFEIKGQPVPKGRARSFVASGRVHHYTPKKTSDYESLVSMLANSVMDGASPIDGNGLTVSIKAIFDPPKSWPMKKRLQALAGNIFPSKPDVDNIAKAILDAMNGIVYKDDSQVSSLWVEKRYGVESKTVVRVTGGEGSTAKARH